MKHQQLTALTKAFKQIFKGMFFEYAKEGNLEKGAKLSGIEVNPSISKERRKPKIKVRRLK